MNNRGIFFFCCMITPVLYAVLSEQDLSLLYKKPPCIAMPYIILFGDADQFQAMLKKHEHKLDNNKKAILNNYLQEKIKKKTLNRCEYVEAGVGKSCVSVLMLGACVCFPWPANLIGFLGTLFKGGSEVAASYYAAQYDLDRYMEYTKMLKVLNEYPDA